MLKYKSILLSLLFLSSFLLIINNVSAVSCIPDSNLYDFCEENTFTSKYDSNAVVSSKIQFSTHKDINEDKNFNINVQLVKFDYKCEGDKTYIYKNIDNYNSIVCDTTGCLLEQEIPLEGEYIGASSSGTVQVDRPVFVCYDSTVRNDGEIVWVATKFGWLGTTPFTFKIVQCKLNNDCSTNQYCETETNQCKIKQCEIGQEKCVGSDLFICSNKYVYDNTGKMSGMCGYTTLLSNDTFITNDTENGDKDDNGVVSERGDNTVLYIVGGLVSGIIILFIVFIILRRKRKIRT